MTNEERNEWLQGLKSGDEIIVYQYGEKLIKRHIHKTTAKLIYVDIYEKSSSYMPQFPRSTGRSSYDSLYPLSDELWLQRIIDTKKIARRINTDLTNSQIERIVAILDEEVTQ